MATTDQERRDREARQSGKETTYESGQITPQNQEGTAVPQGEMQPDNLADRDAYFIARGLWMLGKL